MRNFAKMMGMAVLVAGLAACDGKTTDAPAADKAAAAATTTAPVSLLDGKVTFSLPQ